MRTVHLELVPYDDKAAELRVYTDNPNKFAAHNVRLSELSTQLAKVNLYYDSIIPSDSKLLGMELYRWVNGPKRVLDQTLGSGCVLAIVTTSEFGRLPWELLHDGKEFIVNRVPAVIPVRWLKPLGTRCFPREDVSSDRALSILVMASSPSGITPVLDFEAEEAQILHGTRGRPLTLFVEESGNLQELVRFINDLERGELNVLHLSGHAEFHYGGEPRMIMESEFGDPEYVDAATVARELQFMLPDLVFLSCCRTAQSPDNSTVNSMAEMLVQGGAKAVLGWGNLVSDSSANIAAAELYSLLAAGYTLLESLGLTFQRLFRREVSDWHLLRLFVGVNVPGALAKRGQKPRRRSVSPQFVDPEGILRVAPREAFVGRRRQIQACLRHLKSDIDTLGVIVHGMGGLGKSTIASRLCDRMRGWQAVVWWRVIDEARLVSTLARTMHEHAAYERLVSAREPLRFRLRDVLDSTQEPLLLVFDDFEWNLDPGGGSFELNPAVATLLNELVWAMENSSPAHRIIITSRYDFDAAEFGHKLAKQPLDAFRDADLQKKLAHLANFDPAVLDEELREKALALADGNPRLLEFLNDEVLCQDNPSKALEEVERDPKRWKDRVIWDTLYAQVDDALIEVLGTMGLFTIHVPRSAIDAAAGHFGRFASSFERAVKLGLVEVSENPVGAEPRYRMPRILPHIVDTQFKGGEACRGSACAAAAEELFVKWGKSDNCNYSEWAQIFLLVDDSQPTIESVRHWFSRVLSVQFNEEADAAYEIFLRRRLSRKELEDRFAALDSLLASGDWRAADEETAWLFIQEMVLGSYNPMAMWMIKFPEDVLSTIDELWVRHSKGRFGLSIQRKLYAELMGDEGVEYSTKWGELCYKVGWARDSKWVPYSDFEFELSAPLGHLPILCTARGTWSHSGASLIYPIGNVGLTVCLFGRGWRIGGREPYLFSRWASGNY